MHKRIAGALLIYTGYPISAVISLGAEDEILDVHLFDTRFQAERMIIDPKASRALLISNHPYGQMTPYEQDFVNAHRLMQMIGGGNVRLFLVSEYFSCREITLQNVQWHQEKTAEP